MDNQQPSISSFEYGWMCGIIDGEGCFGLWSRGGNRNHEFKPGFRLSNTSKAVIDAFSNLLDRMAVPYHIVYYKARNERSKEYWTISIEGFKRLKRFLPVIKDALVEKKPQADLIWEWILSRDSKWHVLSYNERELEIPKLVAQLNHRGIRE